MIEFEEPPLDLDSLRREVEQREQRVFDRVLERARHEAQHPARLVGAVGMTLARAAIPGLLAAVASLAALLLTRNQPPGPDLFGALIIEPGPARGWIVNNRAPDPEEVLSLLGGPR